MRNTGKNLAGPALGSEGVLGILQQRLLVRGESGCRVSPVELGYGWRGVLGPSVDPRGSSPCPTAGVTAQGEPRAPRAAESTCNGWACARVRACMHVCMHLCVQVCRRAHPRRAAGSVAAAAARPEAGVPAAGSGRAVRGVLAPGFGKTP